MQLPVSPVAPSVAPTDAAIKSMYNKDPSVICEMIRKLWYIEHNPAYILLPDLQVILATDFSAELLWQGPITVSIGGDGIYGDQYQLTPDKMPIKVAYNPPSEPPWGWIITGTAVGGFIIGFLVDLLVVHH
jgi:hypothetical protein